MSSRVVRVGNTTYSPHDTFFRFVNKEISLTITLQQENIIAIDIFMIFIASEALVDTIKTIKHNDNKFLFVYSRTFQEK